MHEALSLGLGIGSGPKLFLNQPAGFSEPKPAQNRRAQSSASVGPVPSSVWAHSDREQVKACGLGHPQDLSLGPNPMLSGELNWVHGVFSWF